MEKIEEFLGHPEASGVLMVNHCIEQLREAIEKSFIGGARGAGEPTPDGLLWTIRFWVDNGKIKAVIDPNLEYGRKWAK